VSRTVDYNYDVFRRLTKENIVVLSGNSPAGTVRYDAVATGGGIQGYDSVGNRQSRKVVSGALPGVMDYEGNTFDGRNLLNMGTVGSPNPQFDANGNTTQYTANSQTATCLYDSENHLVKQTGIGANVTMVYDAYGKGSV